MKYIFLLGFGRSGATWLADIVSKITGTLILFEPLHPSVTELSKKYAYSEIFYSRDSVILKAYFNDILNKRHRKKWLLRNHVPYFLDIISERFFNMIWDECIVMGFKSIRCNFMIEWLSKHFNSKIVYIVRHPCSVVSSILRRPNFWEFGWPETYEIFLLKTIYNEKYKNHKIKQYTEFVKKAKGRLLKYTIMWAITNSISIPKMNKLELPIFYYEDFYRNPFPSIRKLFKYLGYENFSIHPSYVFTPSMTSLKTVHGLSDKEEGIYNKGASAFWENILSQKEVDKIINTVKYFGINIYDHSALPIK